MTKNVPTITTTFNMSADLKRRAKVYLARRSTDLGERGAGDRLDMGVMLNKGLELLLDRLEGDKRPEGVTGV